MKKYPYMFTECPYGDKSLAESGVGCTRTSTDYQLDCKICLPFDNGSGGDGVQIIGYLSDY